MASDLTCSSCGTEIDSADDVKREELPAIDHDEESDSFSLYGDSENLFLCAGCSKPLGVGRTN